MRGISSKPRVYILKRDRRLPVEEQTRWYLSVLKTTKSADITIGFLSARTTDEESGRDVWDKELYQEVDLEQFLSTVVKVENYWMSEDNPKYHEQGFRDYITPQEITEVYKDLPMDVCTELLQAASSGKLTEIEKVNLGSKSTSNSGSRKK